MGNISSYLKEVRALPKLSQSELTHTIDIYRLTGSTSARNKIIKHYVPLLPQTILQFNNGLIDSDDLIQLANLKLIEIIDSLSRREINNLTAYIITSVNNALLKALAKENKTNILSISSIECQV